VPRPGERRGVAGRRATAAQDRPAVVPDDRAQPRAGRRGIPHLVDPAERDDHGVLHRVVGVRAVSQDGERDRPHPRLVPPQQQPQRRGVAGLGPPDQIRVDLHRGKRYVGPVVTRSGR